MKNCLLKKKHNENDSTNSTNTVARRNLYQVPDKEEHACFTYFKKADKF